MMKKLSLILVAGSLSACQLTPQAPISENVNPIAVSARSQSAQNTALQSEPLKGLNNDGIDSTESFFDTADLAPARLDSGFGLQSENNWQALHAGLPDGDVSFSGMISQGGELYLGLKSRGLYRLAGAQWQKVADKPSKYGLKRLSGDGKSLFASHGESLFQYDQGEWSTMAKLPKGAKIFSGQGQLLVLANNTTNPQIYTYDTTTQTLVNTNFPFSNLDGKPHVQLLEDKQGRLWYRSNYSGVYVYDNGQWSQSHPRSGVVSIAHNGQVYLSYEIKKYTQIASLFAETPDGGWSLVNDEQGYGFSGAAWEASGQADAIVVPGGRFRDFAFNSSQKWRLPSLKTDLSLSDKDTKSVRNRYTTTHGNGVYTVQAYSKNGEKHVRLMAAELEASELEATHTNLKLQTGTYLAGQGDNQAAGVGILENGNIVVGITAANAQENNAQTHNLVENPGAGRILVLNATGDQILNAYNVGEAVLDMTVEGNTIAFASNAGAGLIDAQNHTLTQFVADASAEKRVALNASGLWGTLIGKTLTVRQGAEVMFEKSLQHSYVKDIEMDTARAYAVGFDNKKLPGGNPVQVAFTRTFDLTTGDPHWKQFGFQGQDLSKNIADTRLYRIKKAAGGKLSILGESAGTQTIFRYDGQRFEGDSPLRSIDFYNALWNTASAHVAYVASVDAATGNIDKSQLTMARLSSGKSNTFRVRDVATDSVGRTFIGGTSGYMLAAREAQRVNGEKLGTYQGDPSFLALSTDYRTRLHWTSLNRSGATGRIMGLAADAQKVVMLAHVEKGGEFFTTGNALQSQNNNATRNLYLGVVNIKDNYAN